jgi:hypothetical protein
MPRQHWKQTLAAAVASLVTVGSSTMQPTAAQEAETALMIPAGLRDANLNSAAPIQYLPFAHFTIPFDVDRAGRAPTEVHLWVSPDKGKSWLKHASSTPDKRVFEFHAAAEGEYLFAVQTRDARGDSSLAASPSMRVMIDTTKPELQVATDVNSAGRLVIDYQIAENFLAEESVRLSYCIDGTQRWEDIRVGTLEKNGQGWTGHCEMEMPRCRELQLKLSASDLAQNISESIVRFNAPKTAAASTGLQLASQRADARPVDSKASGQKLVDRQLADQKLVIVGAPTAPPPATQAFPTDGNKTLARQPNVADLRANESSSRKAWSPQTSEMLVASNGGVPWNPTSTQPATPPATPTAKNSFATIDAPSIGLPVSSQQGRVVTAPSAAEELPAPTGIEETTTSGVGNGISISQTETKPINDFAKSGESLARVDATVSPDVQTSASRSRADDAYHSRSRSFSLDYSIDALRGLAVSDIELWGTEDQGKTWQKWGSDPDRESPFDVQVGSDGLFGFRMVIIGANGLVSNRPHDGDDADMWINVDTKLPSVKITRALYGDGAEAGMLVIEFSCNEENLHDRPITLSYSERPTGPWATIAGGLPNSGSYVWKADPNLPQQVYLRIQAVDMAGNIEEHRLELPINLRGLTPRGRIQGFRPIEAK